MKPEEFIKLAEKLVGLGPAGARSAVSRCYYGAFHEAIDLLDDLSCGCPRNGNSHALAPQFLNFPVDADAKTASSLLDDLRAERLKSDYKLGQPESEDIEFAKVGVETSWRVVGLLREFRATCKTASSLRAFQAHVANIKQVRRLP